ncbi:Zinc transporter 9 [Oryzias melastigma]|uniref:Zinc transporter 9 n=1 Tax=Oryzias melastigma TaxID=30732 RepID=A0A834F694_ORYME|nr:Zinc transporter 9 [Oryzias melastigma]
MYSLAHRPWHVFCRISLQHRSSLSHRSPRFPQLCYGWQSASINSSRFSLPDCRVSSVGLGRIQHYSTSGDSKNDPPKAQSAEAPSTDKLSSGDLKATPSSADAAAQGLTKTESIQVKVRAVLKKREYGAKYTQNNFITAVRAMNEFCLKPSDLVQLRKIRRRSPHDDTEAFTVFLRSDVEAKALDVWGSHEALARERNLRKEVEREYQENIFRNQQLLKEYKDFWGKH